MSFWSEMEQKPAQSLKSSIKKNWEQTDYPHFYFCLSFVIPSVSWENKSQFNVIILSHVMLKRSNAEYSAYNRQTMVSSNESGNFVNTPCHHTVNGWKILLLKLLFMMTIVGFLIGPSAHDISTWISIILQRKIHCEK